MTIQPFACGTLSVFVEMTLFWHMEGRKRHMESTTRCLCLVLHRIRQEERWQCIQCQHPYDRSSIELSLVEAVQRRRYYRNEEVTQGRPGRPFLKIILNHFFIKYNKMHSHALHVLYFVVHFFPYTA